MQNQVRTYMSLASHGFHQETLERGEGRALTLTCRPMIKHPRTFLGPQPFLEFDSVSDKLCIGKHRPDCQRQHECSAHSKIGAAKFDEPRSVRVGQAPIALFLFNWML